MPTQESNPESGYRTITTFNSAFKVKPEHLKVRVFSTVDVKCALLYDVDHTVTLYGEAPPPEYLVKEPVDTLDRGDLGIKGENLIGKKVTIVTVISKVNPQGMNIQNEQLDHEIEVLLRYEIEAGYDELVDSFEVKGLFPLKPVEAFRTSLTFVK